MKKNQIKETTNFPGAFSNFSEEAPKPALNPFLARLMFFAVLIIVVCSLFSFTYVVEKKRPQWTEYIKDTRLFKEVKTYFHFDVNKEHKRNNNY